VDSAGFSDLDGADSAAEMLRDGKYIVRSPSRSKRETGSGISARRPDANRLGCQVNWTPDGAAITG